MSTGNLHAQMLQNLKVSQAMRRQIVGSTLYNPAAEPMKFTHNGTPYTIPPDGPSRERFEERPGISKPVVVEDRGEYALYNGQLMVFDHYGVTVQDARKYRQALRSSRGRREPDEPEANHLLAGAEEITQHAIRKLGKAGVIFLTGDANVDGPLIEQAKQINIRFKVAQCERILKNYADRTRAFHNDPRRTGQYAPAMDEFELQAQQWLDEYRLGLKSTKRYVCPTNCGFQANDDAVMDRHMKASHPMLSDAQTAPFVPPSVEEPEELAARPARKKAS